MQAKWRFQPFNLASSEVGLGDTRGTKFHFSQPLQPHALRRRPRDGTRVRCRSRNLAGKNSLRMLLLEEKICDFSIKFDSFSWRFFPAQPPAASSSSHPVVLTPPPGRPLKEAHQLHAPALLPGRRSPPIAFYRCENIHNKLNESGIDLKSDIIIIFSDEGNGDYCCGENGGNEAVRARESGTVEQMSTLELFRSWWNVKSWNDTRR